MAWMNRQTGAAHTDEDTGLMQDVDVLLTTRVGSRTMRRPVGADIDQLQDSPGNPLIIARVTGQVAIALIRWLPALRLKRLQVEEAEMGGRWVLGMDLLKVATGERIYHRVTF